MLKRSNIRLAGLMLLVLFFGVALVQLLRLRFDAGDVYPPYSSLRADPLGVKAFYQSLERLPGMTVRRLYQPLNKVESGPDHALFVLGTRARALSVVSEADFNDLQRFLASGGRVVMSMAPVIRSEREEGAAKKGNKEGELPAKTDSKSPGKKKRAEQKEEKTEKKPKKKGDRSQVGYVSLEKQWGLNFAFENLLVEEDGSTRPELAVFAQTNGMLPRLVPWHTSLCFTNLDPKWETIYRWQKHPVMIERQFGRGSLVLCADSYFLSNEALRKERQPALLAWLVGSKHELIFDETHLGVEEDPGVAALIRKYGLGGLVGGLLALAGLFVWQNTTSFVPPLEPARMEGTELVIGKEAGAGFVNLLRRNVSQTELLSVCYSEWKKSLGPARGRLESRIEAMERIVAEQNAISPSARQPVEGYRALVRILNERK